MCVVGDFLTFVVTKCVPGGELAKQKTPDEVSAIPFRPPPPSLCLSVFFPLSLPVLPLTTIPSLSRSCDSSISTLVPLAASAGRAGLRGHLRFPGLSSKTDPENEVF